MKYELNKPYDFQVTEASVTEDSCCFYVSIGNSLFPVKAYPEQFKDKTPSVISCHIEKDKNDDAFLVQDNAFLFPYLFQKGKKYIFSVISSNEKILVEDKYGFRHTIPNNNIVYYIGEVLIRFVSVVEDKNKTAHLEFFESLEGTKPTTTGKEGNQKDSNSEKEADTQLEKTIVNKKETHQIDTDNITPYVFRLAKYMSSEDWSGLCYVLDLYLYEKDKEKVLNGVKDAIKRCDKSLFWSISDCLLNYNASFFINCLCQLSSELFEMQDTSLNSKYLDDIIEICFGDTSIIPYSFDFLKPLSPYLQSKHKRYILENCHHLDDEKLFLDLFKFLKMTPDDAVEYLITLHKNVYAAYSLFSFYRIADRQNKINDSSQYESLQPDYIKDTILILLQYDSVAFQMAALLMDDCLFNNETCHAEIPSEIKKAVNIHGSAGFAEHVRNIEALD